MSRPKGSRRSCDLEDERKRLVDAKQFLEAAMLLDAPDVIATNAIHAAIAAADVITCHEPELLKEFWPASNSPSEQPNLLNTIYAYCSRLNLDSTGLWVCLGYS